MKFNITKLFVVVFILPLSTIICTYSITLTENRYPDKILPYISATFDYPIASCIGTFGLTVTSTLIVMLVLIRAVFAQRWIGHKSGLHHSHHKALYTLNVIGTIVGLIFTLCIFGIASFQYHVKPMLHNGFAAILFLSGTIYTLLQTVLDFKMRTKGTKVRILRYVCSALGLMAYAPFIILSVTHTPLAQAFGAGIEILMTSLFFLFFTTFSVEFKEIHVLLDIEWLEDADLLIQRK